MISIVIPVLNGYDDTIKLLHNIADTTQLEYEVVLVDDGSTDHTKNLHRGTPVDRLVVKRHYENMGFAAACNTGIEASSGKSIAIFNNDVLLPPRWDTALESALFGTSHLKVGNQYLQLGMVSARAVEPPGKGPQRLHMTEEEFKKTYIETTSLAGHRNQQLNVWDKGIPWLFKKTVFEDVGLFDEQFYPGNYEDNDMWVRMALKGWCYGSVETTHVFHYVHQTLDREFEKEGGSVGLCLKNHRKFVDKWGADPRYLDLGTVAAEGKFGKVRAEDI
jgi:GT2 family glycosyltransferase